MMEEQFKNYKEKQQHYRNKLKRERMVWVSKEPGNSKTPLIKGRTYCKRGDV